MIFIYDITNIEYLNFKQNTVFLFVIIQNAGGIQINLRRIISR